MELYKLGKTIENQKIEFHLALHKLNEARDELKHSLKRRKDISIEENDTQYQDIDTTELFSDGNTSEFDAKITNLVEKNGALTKETINLKIE